MIKEIVQSKFCKSIVCLDGDINWHYLLDNELPIIAVDGAANQLIANNIEPDIIIGDLDSVDASILINRRCEKTYDQNFTDFEKALIFIKENKLSPSVILGASGGCIDHILCNISLISRFDCVAISPDIIFFPLSQSISFPLDVGTKISIFAMPKCVLTSFGFRWNLDKKELSFGDFNSISNRIVDSSWKLNVLEGRAMMFVYLNDIYKEN